MAIRAALASGGPWSSRTRSPRRVELRACLTFLEGAKDHDWGVSELRAWFEEHLVAPGCMPSPVLVTELSAGTIALHGTDDGLAARHTLQRVLQSAQRRVLSALRGLIATPSDDRFLHAAIFTGRVKRSPIEGASPWMLRPEPTATLSGIVLGLFAVDILSHREVYDRGLSVCDACARLTFHESTQSRTRCPDHPPAVSGVRLRAVTERGEPGST